MGFGGKNFSVRKKLPIGEEALHDRTQNPKQHYGERPLGDLSKSK
jgi:hypothetical protein